MKIKITYIAIQFTYWSIYCVTYGLASLYLLEKGFKNTEIGITLALSNIISMFFQWIISSVLLKNLELQLRSCLIFLVIINILFLLIQKTSQDSSFLVASYSLILISITLTLQPFINSLAFEFINNNIHIDFPLSRGFGSLSFSITSILLGGGIFKYSSGDIFTDSALVLNISLLFPIIILNVKKNTEKEKPTIKKDGLFRSYPFLFLFLCGVSFLFCFHTIVTSFLAQIIFSFNGSNIDVSMAFMIAGLSELPIMFLFSYLLRRKSALELVKLSSLYFLIRSLILLLASSSLITQFSQLLQALSFALFVPASAFLLNQYTNKQDSVHAQTYLNVAMTLGAVIGALIGGLLFDLFKVTAILTFGSLTAGIGCFLVYFSLSLLKKTQRIKSVPVFAGH